jgi:hypothetical protein
MQGTPSPEVPNGYSGNMNDETLLPKTEAEIAAQAKAWQEFFGAYARSQPYKPNREQRRARAKKARQRGR